MARVARDCFPFITANATVSVVPPLNSDASGKPIEAVKNVLMEMGMGVTFQPASLPPVFNVDLGCSYPGCVTSVLAFAMQTWPTAEEASLSQFTRGRSPSAYPPAPDEAAMSQNPCARDTVAYAAVSLPIDAKV